MERNSLSSSILIQKLQLVGLGLGLGWGLWDFPSFEKLKLIGKESNTRIESTFPGTSFLKKWKISLNSELKLFHSYHDDTPLYI
jgi:hypothetical protein